MDLLKAFDTMNYDVLVAKLYGYGFISNKSLRVLKSYPTNRWLKTKVNMSFSNWFELLL